MHNMEESYNWQGLDAWSLKRRLCDILVRAIVDIGPPQAHAINFLSSK